jgi:hypothetical protein
MSVYNPLVFCDEKIPKGDLIYMKMKFMILVAAMFIAAVFSGCGWNPSVTATPITAPWSSMNLPVKDNAIVWASSATQLKVAHRDGKSDVMDAYKKAIEAAGWKMTNMDVSAETSKFLTFEKDGKTMEAEFYDFENTGVILQLK